MKKASPSALRVKSVKCPRCSQPTFEYDGASLREVRLAAGLSLRAVAEKMGVTFPYLSDVERGRRRVTDRVADAYVRLK